MSSLKTLPHEPRWQVAGHARRKLVRAAGAPAASHKARGNGRIRFRSGLGRNLRRKEWRLLVRDPGIFAQLALQIVENHMLNGETIRLDGAIRMAPR